MRVLLDENIDRFLKPRFDADMEVLTVEEQGWKGMKNGELLRVAQGKFDVFVSGFPAADAGRYRKSVCLGA